MTRNRITETNWMASRAAIWGAALQYGQFLQPGKVF